MSQAVTISIRLFAQTAQVAAATNVVLQLEPNNEGLEPELVGVTVQQIADELCRHYPQMSELIRRSRWAIDNEFVGPEHFVLSGTCLAIIPPVSGG